MLDTVSLLDTPKRVNLQEKSQTLRAALKSFEHSFASEHGRKPKQNEIKNDVSIAGKYKEYRRIQDVLAGKIAYEKLSEQRSKPNGHSRKDSGIGSSPRRNQHVSPNKARDVEVVESPKVFLKTAIGPTPHRDGKVLGLFDVLASGSSEGLSSSARKRKIDALYQDSPEQRSPLKVIQTPSRRSDRKGNDILKYLQGTPEQARIDHEKFSRTPQSEGRKFQLSQFFATPSTQRILFGASPNNDAGKETSSDTPQKQPDAKNLETTPAYLKRSTSFKDRLLSASRPTSPKFGQSKRFNPAAVPRSSSTGMPGPSASTSLHPATHYDDPYDDDLEALRDAEDTNGSRPQILVKDSQANDIPTLRPEQPIYKKKGQKRTTKKANIKPVHQPQSTAKPKFIAADNSDNDTDDDCEANDPEFVDGLGGEQHGAAAKHASKAGKDKLQLEGSKKVGKINPNAQSHMNFRSLKIKNKNSRANGTGRRFGRRR